MSEEDLLDAAYDLEIKRVDALVWMKNQGVSIRGTEHEEEDET